MIWLTILVLLLSAAAPAWGEEETPSVYSYDFDLHFSLNADEFPVRSRAHMKGYAELLDSLMLKGNITWCPAYESLDLNVRIIPVSNPDSSISFRLFGIPSDLCLSSPLLGDETIWFDNFVLMEFALKAWNNYRIPLQYPSLMLPYVTTDAFSNLASVWDQHIGSPSQSTVISAETIRNVANDWKTQVEKSDTRLGYWILALSSVASDQGIMENEFMNLPDYLLDQVSHGGELLVTVNGNSETWTNQAGETLFERVEDEDASRWALSLPATASGYVPRLSVSSRPSEDSLSFSASGSYNRTPDASPSGTSLPGSLLAFSMQVDSWPLSLVDSEFTASLKTSGILIPEMNLMLFGKTKETGEINIDIHHPVIQGGETRSILSCYGTVTPAETSVVPRYSPADLRRYLRIFGVNDQSLGEFVRKITRPLFYGILNFLYELPARGCQSVMDDLEEYGILDMLLSE